MIYFIQGEITRRIKIGFTKGFIEARLNALQIGSPDKLNIVAAQLGNEKDEHQLHIKFDQHRSHGEWFFECDEVFDYIEEYCFKDKDLIQSVQMLEKQSLITKEEAFTKSPEEIKDMYQGFMIEQLEKASG